MEDMSAKLKDLSDRIKKALPTQEFEQASRVDLVIDDVVYVIKDRWGTAPRIDNRI